jgi:hypothetical protein
MNHAGRILPRLLLTGQFLAPASSRGPYFLTAGSQDRLGGSLVSAKPALRRSRLSLVLSRPVRVFGLYTLCKIIVVGLPAVVLKFIPRLIGMISLLLVLWALVPGKRRTD